MRRECVWGARCWEWSRVRAEASRGKKISVFKNDDIKVNLSVFENDNLKELISLFSLFLPRSKTTSAACADPRWLRTVTLEFFTFSCRLHFRHHSYTTSTKCCSSSCESVSSTRSCAYARQSTNLSTSTPSFVPRRCGRCRPAPCGTPLARPPATPRTRGALSACRSALQQKTSRPHSAE